MKRYPVFGIALFIFLAGSLKNFSENKQGNEQDNMDAMKNKTLKIMPMGDSITAGYFTVNGGYRRYLKVLFAQNGYKVDFVGRNKDRSGDMPDPEHEGYSGYTIRQIGEKAEEAVPMFKPDIILLFAGTNDIRDNNGNNVPSHPDYWVTADERLDRLIGRLFVMQPGVIVLVGNLLPFTGSWAYGEERAVAFNAKLPAIAKKYQDKGEEIIPVDFRKEMTAAELSDGLHPNDKGYATMALIWFENLEPVLNALRNKNK